MRWVQSVNKVGGEWRLQGYGDTAETMEKGSQAHCAAALLGDLTDVEW